MLSNDMPYKRSTAVFRYRLGLFALSIFLFSPANLFAQEGPSRIRFIHWMYRDLGGLAEATFTPRVGLYAGGIAAGTAGLAIFDDDVQDGLDRVYTGSVKRFLDTVSELGGPRVNLPVVLLAGGSMFTSNTRFQDAAFTSFQTLVYAGILGYALKGIFGRGRPEITDDPYAFFKTTGKNPFSNEGNSSYPSGHAIAVFGIVTPWITYYPSVLTYSLYVIPAGTAIARLAQNKHWATDIVVGATIGIAMGSWLSRRHMNVQKNNERFELTLAADGYLISCRVKL